MRTIGIVVFLLLGTMVVILPVEVQAQSTIYSTQTGDWKDTATWLGGVVPGTTDTAVICDGHTVTLDDNRTVKLIETNATSTFVIGDNPPLWSITLTFDDGTTTGFVQDETDGNLYINGTTTYPHTIRASNLPAVSNGWKGWWSNWPATGSITEVHNTSMYNVRNWATGHEALAKYSNITIDQYGVVSGAVATFVPWEPTAGSFFNDISINGSATNSHDTIYIMPDSSHVFIRNLVITNNSGIAAYEVEIDEGTTGEVVHFRDSNFDETNFDFWGGGEECHWISQDHKDTSGRYLTGVHAGFNSSKSYVASGWDFGASDTVELIEGTLTIDENADVASFFIEETDAGIEVLSGYTLDLTTNLTNNGTIINNGTITDSGDYFNFYNTNPGGIWFNNSTVSNAKLAYYYGGFNFTIGNSANSTINEWTLEAPSGIDTSFIVTYYDFNNKGSGVIWHLNATASSGSVKVVTTNLSAGVTYRSYVDLIQHTEGTASGDAYNFTVSMSTKHIYLTWLRGTQVGNRPGAGVIRGIGATFDYIIISDIMGDDTVEFRPEPIGRFDNSTISYYWEFSDGDTSNEMNPTKTFEYGGITGDFTASLTICNENYCSHPVERDIHLIRWWLIVLILAAIITPIILGMRYVDRKYR